MRLSDLDEVIEAMERMAADYQSARAEWAHEVQESTAPILDNGLDALTLVRKWRANAVEGQANGPVSARARILWEAEMDATLKAILTIAEAEANDEWAEVRRFATEARDMLLASPAPSGEGERIGTVGWLRKTAQALEAHASTVEHRDREWLMLRDHLSIPPHVRVDDWLRSHPTEEDEWYDNPRQELPE